MSEEKLCPKCGTPMYLAKKVDADGWISQTETEWMCHLTPQQHLIYELKAQIAASQEALEAEQKAHAATKEALRLADEALIASMPDVSVPDIHGNRRKTWHKGFTAALARREAEKGGE